MLRRTLIALALTAALAAPALAQRAVRMDLNAIYPATNFHSQGAADFAERVKEYTGGSVVITVHPGGSLGFKGPELLKTVKDGTVPLSDVLMGVVQGSEKVFGLSSLPMLVSGYEEARKFYDAARPAYEAAAAKWNQKILYVVPWPPSGLFTKKEVAAAGDIAGLKTRTYDKNGADFLASLQGSPISMPWGEVYAALQTGMIDSVLTSAVSGQDAKLWEVLSHFQRIHYAYPLNMVVINLDYWNGLTAEQKAAVEKAAAETEAKQWEASAQDNEAALKAVADGGIKISDMNPALAEALRKAAAAIVEQFAADAGPEVKGALEAYRK